MERVGQGRTGQDRHAATYRMSHGDERVRHAGGECYGRHFLEEGGQTSLGVSGACSRIESMEWNTVFTGDLGLRASRRPLTT
jgi:hypothetical protein